jgi:hypothetical protein
VAYEPFRDDVRHERVRVMPALAALKFQREGERCRQVFGIRGSKVFFEVAHEVMIEQIENQGKSSKPVCVAERLRRKSLGLALLRPVEEDYQLIDDGRPIGLRRDVGGDQPLSLKAQRRAGTEGGFELGFAGVISRKAFAGMRLPK